MLDEKVVACPKCGKSNKFKAGNSGSGTTVVTCPACHKQFFLVIQVGKIVGTK